jgi:hypothetical protein
MEVLEHNFMGEQRSPFKGSDLVRVSAANQFVLAVGEFDEFCVTKLPD